MPRNIQITLAYDGYAYAGFQRQANGLAVQEVVEQALERIHGARTTLYFVARTDAGVHAWAQECTFYTDGTIPAAKYKSALNALLPPTVRVRRAVERPEDYSVRRTNTGKTYVYQILRGEADQPFLYRTSWQVYAALDVAAMRSACDVLAGTHDFTSYRGSNSVPADPVRTLYDVRIATVGRLLRIYVTGDGFLYHMVRNIAGALVDVGRGRKTAADLVRIRAAKDRRLLGMTAPAAGLCLLHTYFDAVTPAAIADVLRTPVPLWNDGRPDG